MPKLEEVLAVKFEVTTEVYDQSGKHLIGEIAQIRRTIVPLNKISKNIQDALISAEDARFYAHNGVDYQGMAAAIYRRAKGGRLTGASTLTQQTIKNLLELLRKKKSERDLDAKIEEALFAQELTIRMKKEEVLELYLNTVFFGNNRYGVEAAMQYYFGHSAEQASLSEAALLVSLVKGANNYVGGRTEKEKVEHHKKWETRRAYVLGRMVANHVINQAQADEAAKEPIILVEGTGEKPGIYDEFIDLVEEQLKVEYGDQLLKAGVKVVTTCDYEAQRKAKEAMKGGLEQIDVMNGDEKDKDDKEIHPRPEGAKVMIDETGAMRVLVGGYGYRRGNRNRAILARRQPGSLFKTFLYAAAFDSGLYTPDSMLLDAEITLPAPEAGAKDWTPHNSHESETNGQEVTAAYGLAKSLNTVAAQLLFKMRTEQNKLAGIDAMIAITRDLGVKSHIGRNDAQILGVTSAQVLEMAIAYNTMSNGGKRPTPYVIQKIVNGKERTIKAPEQAIKPRTAQLTHEALLKVTEEGTGARAHRELKRKVAGKTGTTQEAKDAWFCGSVQSDGHTYTDCTWVGYDNNTSLGKIVKGKGAGHDFDGASAALGCIWIPFMKAFLNDKPVEEFPQVAEAVQVTAKPAVEATEEPATTLDNAEQPAQPTEETQTEETNPENTGN